MRDQWNPQTSRWGERQNEMLDAYRELADDPPHTRLAYRNDFGPYETLLADVRGPTLDLGGGHGLIRDFLPSDTEYVSLEPSLDWLDERWLAAADAFPSLAEPPFMVRGVGERIPFRDETFATILSFWSLNHTSNPRLVLSEARRVLRTGGRLFLVLDDIPPRWRDIQQGAYRDHRFPSRGALVRGRLRSLFSGWPLQTDHLRISERDLARWIRGRFDVGNRLWVGSYFTLDLQAR